MDERRAGEYIICQAMRVGKKEVVLGEHDNPTAGYKWLCAYYESNAYMGQYYDCMVSDDYAEIIAIFADRVKSAAVEHMAVLNGGDFTDDDKRPLDGKSEIVRKITGYDDLNNSVIVLRPETLRPEYRHGVFQLMLCVGGFGAAPLARGRSCACVNLIDGKDEMLYRDDILGVVDHDRLPEWAKNRLKDIIEQRNAERENRKNSRNNDAR